MARQSFFVKLLALVVIAPAFISCGDDGGRSGPSIVPSIEESGMRLVSPAFEDLGTIPVRHTCDGEDISPPLELDGVPEGARSLVLIVEDPDAPSGTWDHWVEFDIDPGTTRLGEGDAPGVPGRNSWDERGYRGPCPPDGNHRYVFRLLALDATVELPAGATKSEVLGAAEEHVLAEARLTGRYGR